MGQVGEIEAKTEELEAIVGSCVTDEGPAGLEGGKLADCFPLLLHTANDAWRFIP